jgi:hypothetical protein
MRRQANPTARGERAAFIVMAIMGGAILPKLMGYGGNSICREAHRPDEPLRSWSSQLSPARADAEGVGGPLKPIPSHDRKGGR